MRPAHSSAASTAFGRAERLGLHDEAEATGVTAVLRRVVRAHQFVIGRDDERDVA